MERLSNSRESRIRRYALPRRPFQSQGPMAPAELGISRQPPSVVDKVRSLSDIDQR